MCGFTKTRIICFRCESLYLPPLGIFSAFFCRLKCDKDDSCSVDRRVTAALVCITDWFLNAEIYFPLFPFYICRRIHFPDWYLLRAYSRICFWVHWVRFLSQTVLQVDFWLFISHLLVAALPPTRSLWNPESWFVPVSRCLQQTWAVFNLEHHQSVFTFRETATSGKLQGCNTHHLLSH